MRLLATAAMVLMVGGCASTRFTTVWRDPAAGAMPFEKVFVVAVMPEEPVKRSAEDLLVRQLAPTGATPEYAVISPQEARDRRRAEARVKELGFDAALVMRLARVDHAWGYHPAHWPPPYYSFWGYYDYAYPLAYEPAYIVVDTVVQFETNLYRVADGKLVWSGLSETFNPGSASELVGEVAAAVGRELREQGLIAPRHATDEEAAPSFGN
jgi:hypothetical protein